MDIYDRINELSVAQMRARLALIYQFTQFVLVGDSGGISEDVAEGVADMILGPDEPGEAGADWIKRSA